MTTVPNQPESNDASIEELLREVGARDEPSSDAARDVMSAVHAEWLSIVQQRRRQQRVVAWRIAAGVALAVLVSTFAYRSMTPAAEQVASVEHIDGRLLASTDDDGPIARTKGEFIRVGDTVQTDAQSRAAVSFPDGLSLRLDHGTRLTVDATDHIVLDAGAVYIDAPPSAKNHALTVATVAGSVQHVGTQYEVRTQANAMLVSVREGRVVLTHSNGSNTGEAGQVLRLSNDGELTRSILASTDPQWHWALQAAPAFDIENQSLATFLQWIARETGRHVVYSSPAAESAATAVKLRGSIAGLDSDAALAAVLSTTQLRRYQTNATEIGIELTSIDSSAPARPTH
ncbi:FecR domain-containing protein [Steroidobacter sp.]|uniref:FecR domain-containing protein n=1 Tax=Steroidobacter sp. TaxID=1978227 RepID=UPI001A4E225B|nr:FecR family protein [Steroidobacter sp.]MBL8267939.1 FecR domain-containing protein [Steroidobacter sp.]